MLKDNPRASAPADGPFPPINRLRLLSNQHYTAVLDHLGRIVFMGGPLPHSDTFFTELLHPGAGSFGVLPLGLGEPTFVGYEDRTMTGETIWSDGENTLRVRHFLAITTGQGPLPVLVTLVECEGGQVTVRLSGDPKFGYGLHPTRWEPRRGDAQAATIWTEDRGFAITAETDMPALTVSDEDGSVITTELTLNAGEHCFATLVLGAGEHSGPQSFGAAERLAEETQGYWQTLLDNGRRTLSPRLERDALMLLALYYQPTGAFLAAATTSLPEGIGGVRNWDYRYPWSRDVSMMVRVLLALGLGADEARAWLNFLHRQMENGDPLQVMYRVDGGTDLPEIVLDHLRGYRDSRPVRAGNGAAHGQLQLDCPAWVLQLMVGLVQETNAELTEADWALIQRLAEQVITTWRTEDSGLWEMRGLPLRHCASAAMCLAALLAAAWLARHLGQPAEAKRYAQVAGRIAAEVQQHGFNADGCLMQSFGSDRYDAGALLALKFGFPMSGAQRRATLDGVLEHLQRNGLVYRYHAEATPDGLPGDEGAFVITSAWAVEALALDGRVEEARARLERLRSFGGVGGVFAEMVDPDTGEQLGNFPQGFSHLGLAQAELVLVRAEKRAARVATQRRAKKARQLAARRAATA